MDLSETDIRRVGVETLPRVVKALRNLILSSTQLTDSGFQILLEEIRSTENVKYSTILFL